MALKIRPIESNEQQQQLINLQLECVLVLSRNNPEKDIQPKLHVHLELLLSPIQSGQLIGSIMAGYDGHREWLNYLGVLPTFQRKEICKELVEA